MERKVPSGTANANVNKIFEGEIMHQMIPTLRKLFESNKPAAATQKQMKFSIFFCLLLFFTL
jgi:mannose/fructose/N-acetylgalactosamine-specific phosphotransferase system component IID